MNSSLVTYPFLLSILFSIVSISDTILTNITEVFSFYYISKFFEE